MELSKKQTNNTIRNWKRRGVIHTDYNALYDKYINTTRCNHCDKEFKDSRDRCMDHDHNTGLFRNIVCKWCNNKDNYINNPTGRTVETDKKRLHEWYIKNKEKILERTKKQNINDKDFRKEKITCECGCIITRGSMLKHKKSNRHISHL